MTRIPARVTPGRPHLARRVLTVWTALALISACGGDAAPAQVGTFSLTVQDIGSHSVDVVPWSHAASTRLSCNQSVVFTGQSASAPALPWRIAIKRVDGSVVLQATVPAGSGPEQVWVTNEGAQLVPAGGSHGAPGVQC